MKEVEPIMKEETLLDIICRIKCFIEKNELSYARDYVQLEIDNLKGITPEYCLKTRYAYDWYCKQCSNLNCSSNKNKKDENSLS